MKAVYMDTKDMILRKNHITYRIRKEGNLFAATVKWKGRTEGNLHIRNEINKAGYPLRFLNPVLPHFRPADMTKGLVCGEQRVFGPDHPGCLDRPGLLGIEFKAPVRFRIKGNQQALQPAGAYPEGRSLP